MQRLEQSRELQMESKINAQLESSHAKNTAMVSALKLESFQQSFHAIALSFRQPLGASRTGLEGSLTLKIII